jgi:hypothetical protein
MSLNIGIWLDRSRAVIVRLADKKMETVTLSSEMEKARHPQCGTEGRCTIIPEHRLQQRRKEIVRKFYKKIIGLVKNAGSVLILGPGPAKNEFVNEIDRVKSFRCRIAGVESADNISTVELEGKVRLFFEGFPRTGQLRPPELMYAMRR